MVIFGLINITKNINCVKKRNESLIHCLRKRKTRTLYKHRSWLNACNGDQLFQVKSSDLFRNDFGGMHRVFVCDLCLRVRSRTDRYSAIKIRPERKWNAVKWGTRFFNEKCPVAVAEVDMQLLQRCAG